jgi:arsenate reductase
VLVVMDELGIDLRSETPKLLTRELAEWADVVVTMGCGDACPYIPSKRYLDWELEDPKGQSLDAVRITRDEIAHRVDGLLSELNPAAAPLTEHPSMAPPLPRRLLAEYLGSAFLAALVIGSGIAAQNLSPGDTGPALLENAAATAAGLFAIILMFGPVSGGHFNPVVSLVDAHFGGLPRRETLAYIPAQIAGCITGAIVANGMFALTAISISTHHRASPAHLLAEMIATLGLILVIFSLARTGRAATAAAAVAAYIGAAYWFTSSTSFAKPAISIGRIFSNTFAGIAPASVPGFVVAQLVGGAVATAVIRILYPDVTPAAAAQVVMPHDGAAELDSVQA